MSESSFQRTRPHLNVGTIGHAEHGKTTLAAALTRALAGRYPGRTRPLSIAEIAKGGFLRRGGETFTVIPNALEYESAARHYGHIDLPGRRSYLKNAATGAALLDAAILVVAADASVAPQTREHVLLARHAGAAHFLIFINKCDLAADTEIIDLVEAEARELLVSCGLPGDAAPVLRGSARLAYEGDARWQPPLLALAEALDAWVPLAPRSLDGPPLLRVAHVYPRGRDVVVSGRLERGRIRRGDRLELLGRGQALKNQLRPQVVDLEIFGSKVEEGQAGDILGVLLRGEGLAGWRRVQRGQVLTAPGAVTLKRRFLAEVYVLKTAEGGRHTPFFDGHQAHFFLGLDNLTGTIRLRGVEGAQPGATVQLEVELLRDTLLEPGMRFSFRDGCDGLRRLYGGGRSWGGTAGVGTIRAVPD